MKEYRIIINDKEIIIKQDKDGKFIKPEFVMEQEQYGSALKPSWEPIIMARKPFKGSLVDNVLQHGVGGLNIDECRVPFEDTPNPATNPLYRLNNGYKDTAKIADSGASVVNFGTSKNEVSQLGRFPANTILTYDEADFNEVCGGFPKTKGGGKTKEKGRFGFCFGEKRDSKPMADGYDDSGSASRYFYCAKASKRDRDEGLEDLPEKKVYGDDMNWGYGNTNGDNFGDRIANVKRRNIHPTVKPTSLMQYLVRLVAPKGATILDPFMGSGSTGKAVAYENRERNARYNFIGIEKDPEYCNIAQARIDYVAGEKNVEENT